MMVSVSSVVFDEFHALEQWQLDLAVAMSKVSATMLYSRELLEDLGSAMIVTTGVRAAELTMEFSMAPIDPFDPFKVEAGCAHPEDYREPLPYHGAPPSDDEWLCSACGYWRKGSAFGVTALPQPEPLTDKELDDLLEKQAKMGPDFRDSYIGQWSTQVGADLSIEGSVAASFPIPYPRLPMANAQVSYNAIKALMHELEDRNRQRASILYSPDITVNAAGSMITALSLVMQYNDKTTPIKTVTDGLYTLESVSRTFVRAREQHFEAHPRTIYDLANEFLTPAMPLVQPSLSAPLPWRLLGWELREQRVFNPGMIALVHS